ncbi:MAG: hypothetical protein EAZ78_10265 [Oscillatoriales cyanobacterium]|uniref:Glycosyl hydrolase family 28-related protein n=1 Tax=Microcoleus anatoxicus PTRS2 TaxID=2705321 RepID=A0ABU8YG38_9CYAN|nr:MAG: hypothetical protein EA000_15990 [Oscillatoriales cyanobacterium]TAD95832.1 MAG: hypothetical protein EAZ98_14440 [Oscillatoriales cyanobacterium]TAE03469.1 MAG: hypothetical protein EAZ96_12840 [Oscillatoriales cyanobacterium]TAF04068.1 MAG: hypothetical protein EAZ78_10265 [Oscillatoriales cyanobacterium]TAF48016.1 MAG: hypothetical protein EAZ68_00535 [Oscillatoriales cyanobacterium]
MNKKKSQCLIAASLLATSGFIYVTVAFVSKLVPVNTPLRQTASARYRHSLVQITKQMAVVLPQQLSQAKTHLVRNPEFLNNDVRMSEEYYSQGKFVSVKELGAIGNNIADDTKAIQKAIDAVFKAGGGVVFFPSGTYKVTINSARSQAIVIRAQVTLKGTDRRDSIIKLADQQGNYNSIMAGETYESDLSNFSMYDLTIDGNATNNIVVNERDFLQQKERYALRIYVGSKIRIYRCIFRDQSNVNTITINGEKTVSDVAIIDNVFEQIGGGFSDYDHSTIYGHGKRMQIYKNIFYSRNGAGTNGARTAIETHGDEYIVKKNVISGFANGMNITGYAKSSKNQIINDNIIKDAHTGIILWSYFDSGNTTNPSLIDCTVANNKISLNVNDWRGLWGDAPSTGIKLDANSDAPMTNVNIVNNQIIFANFSGRGRLSDRLAAGISLWRKAAPAVVSENINISNNLVENSLGSGIYISMPVKGGEISKNTIVNPGQSTGYFHNDYKSGIIASGVFKDFHINDNVLRDTQKVNTIRGGILWLGNCVANCNAKGNYLQVDSGVKLEVLRSSLEVVKP